MDAAPFRAVWYDQDVAGPPATTSAPAYEDVERLAYAAHRAASPYTVLELFAPRTDDGYTTAGAALARWWRTGVLRQDHHPAYYLYEQHELRGPVPAVQRGVLAAVRLAPLGSPGALLPHERVEPARVADRLERLRSAPLEVSPVFALYEDGPPRLRALLDRPKRSGPIAALTDEQGVDHRVWRLDDPADIEVVTGGLAAVRGVIADGHHRWAAALAFREEQRAEGRSGTCAERTLVYLVDATTHGPRVEPIHRIVHGLPPDTYERLGAVFSLEHGPPTGTALLRAVGGSADLTFGLVHGGKNWLLRARDPDGLRGSLPGDRSRAWHQLDAAVFEHGLLPLLGGHGAVEPRSDALGAEAAVGADPRAGLFLLRPPDQTAAISLALAGEPMPAKSTSFQPKPRTGLVMRRAGR